MRNFKIEIPNKTVDAVENGQMARWVDATEENKATILSWSISLRLSGPLNR